MAATLLETAEHFTVDELWTHVGAIEDDTVTLVGVIAGDES